MQSYTLLSVSTLEKTTLFNPWDRIFSFHGIIVNSISTKPEKSKTYCKKRQNIILNSWGGERLEYILEYLAFKKNEHRDLGRFCDSKNYI